MTIQLTVPKVLVMTAIQSAFRCKRGQIDDKVMVTKRWLNEVLSLETAFDAVEMKQDKDEFRFYI